MGNPTQAAVHAAAQLKTAARPSLNETVERLRSATTPDSSVVFDVDRLSRLVTAVSSSKPLDVMAGELDASPDDVVNAISGLGTWLSQVHGPAKCTFVPVGTLAAPTLFAVPVAGDDVVEIDPSLTCEAVGRDLSAALSAIITYRPSARSLSTFRLRKTHAGAAATVTFETVAAVAMFARLGRLASIGQVNPTDPVLHAVLCNSYDLLDVARYDAVNAIGVLAGLLDGLDVKQAAVMARPVFRDDVDRWLKAAQTGDETLICKQSQLLEARIVRQLDRYALADISKLDTAQVIRIAEAAGLDLGRDRSVESAARQLLADAGVSANADVLLVDAMSAIRADRVDEFLEQL